MTNLPARHDPRCAASRAKRCVCSCGGALHGKHADQREGTAPFEKPAKRGANWSYLSEDEVPVDLTRVAPDCVVIRDDGPRDLHPTVTNDVENVARSVAATGRLRGGRRLFYYDSEGSLDEILVGNNGAFLGFRPDPRRAR